MLVVYAQAAPPGFLQVWVGVYGSEAPAPLAFTIDRAAAQPLAPVRYAPIRDGRSGPGGGALNHRAIVRFRLAEAGRRHLVEVSCGDERRELATSTLPDAVPQALDGSFNILLGSCYYQPEDDAGLLGTIVTQIQILPQLVLLAGDQIYGDLPLFEDLPDSEPALSQRLGDKYLTNWASTQLRVPGLEAVLARAPVATIPDDHEFWNNFPFRQKQLPNTWQDASRQRWQRAAQALYEDYQLAADPAAAGATRLDVLPLRMLMLDMRCARDDAFGDMLNPAGVAALAAWVADLLADKAAGRPGVGLLSSGQAIFIDPPTSDGKKRDVDAEMGNYAQFALIEQAITTLVDAGVPVVYVTGDVHWGRVASGDDRTRPNRRLLYEVICSPSRLIRTPLVDAGKETLASAKGIFGKKDPWPRHADAETPPPFFGAQSRFAVNCEFKQRGDQVAMLSFAQAGNGLDLDVRYYGIHPDKSLQQSRPVRTIQLRPLEGD